MGLATDLVKFFDIYKHGSEPRTLGDFFGEHKGYDVNLIWEAASICRRLIDVGMLTAAGKGNGSPPLNECYWTALINFEKVDTPIFEFIAYGFPEIFRYYGEAIRPISLERDDGEPDIGTCFLLKNRMIMTARHCIENMQSVKIQNLNPKITHLTIDVPKDESIDLAILTCNEDPFPGLPGLKIGKPRILANVLTLGYPPIQGFDIPLVAEKAQIAAMLKASTGSIVAHGKSYLHKHNYLLLSARVKGGNSGGPVIDESGFLIGIITHFPAEESGRPDLLGYAAALPSDIISEFIRNVAEVSENVKETKVQIFKDSFSTGNFSTS